MQQVTFLKLSRWRLNIFWLWEFFPKFKPNNKPRNWLNFNWTAQRLPCDRAIRTSLLIILQRGRYFYRSTLVGHSWILDSGFWILDSTPWIPESLSVELGFRIPIVGMILDCLSCNPDFQAQDSGSHNFNFLDSGFHKRKLPQFRNVYSLTCGEGWVSCPAPLTIQGHLPCHQSK